MARSLKSFQPLIAAPLLAALAVSAPDITVHVDYHGKARRVTLRTPKAKAWGMICPELAGHPAGNVLKLAEQYGLAVEAVCYGKEQPR